jgi:hypothetical protein
MEFTNSNSFVGIVEMDQKIILLLNDLDMITLTSINKSFIKVIRSLLSSKFANLTDKSVSCEYHSLIVNDLMFSFTGLNKRSKEYRIVSKILSVKNRKVIVYLVNISYNNTYRCVTVGNVYKHEMILRQNNSLELYNDHHILIGQQKRNYFVSMERMLPKLIRYEK